MTIENTNLYRQELIQKYRAKIEPIFRYIPWLTQKQGAKTSYLYQGEDVPVNSVPVPVYDPTLLSFVKDMQATGLMQRNYVYVFSRCKLRSRQDELRYIAEADLTDIEDIFDIMAKYVLGGMTKGRLWSEGVENGVFLQALLKMKEVLEVWDKPLA